MKICITSDIHLHLFREFDRLTEEGKSFRLSLYEKSLQYLIKYCQENKIHYWIDAGDVFHSRESISLPVLDLLGKCLSYAKTIFKTIYFTKGNHDSWNKLGNITSLNILTEYGNVINERCISNIDGIKSPIVHFIPWDENINFVDTVNKYEKTNLVIAHRMIKGASQNNFILDGESIENLDNSKFDYAFIGHVHEHQKLEKNIYYIGSLVSNNFNDKNQEKGFIVYDFETKTFERIINPYSPVFKQIEIFTKEDLQNINPKENEFFELKIKIKQGQDINELINILPKNSRMTTMVDQKEENRLNENDLLTPQSLLEKYCEMNKLDENLKNIGKEILENCLIK